MFILNEVNSVANLFLLELRDTFIQKDSLRFRRNLERIGEILAYEVSKSFEYEQKKIKTPLGESSIPVLKEQPVLISVLRAGLPFYQGFLNIFDRAESGFIGAFRNPHDADFKFDVSLNYLAIPSIQDKIIVLIDPMLATGSSLLKAIQVLESKGKPKHIHIMSLIAAPEGINFLEKNINVPYTLWTAAVDEKLNNMFYIVPGLGDAGDLSFGSKL